ncbi:MAG: hypothetical protein GY772_21910, partial [bacterium]|nr:hypothetical protein [bacterium]
MSKDVVEALREARLWPDIQVSEVFEDDWFAYTNVRVPRWMRRGTTELLAEAEWRAMGVQLPRGWEHYAWHRPEPSVLMFRRPRQRREPGAREGAGFLVEPFLQRGAPERVKDESALETAAVPAALMEARPPTTGAEPLPTQARPLAAEARPLAAEAAPVVAEARPLAAEARPLAAEARPLAAEARPLAAEATPLAAEATPLAAEAEPLAAEAEALGAGTDDERLAALGLSPKLHHWQIPEWHLIWVGLQKLVHALAFVHPRLRVRALVRLFVVLRGIRGVEGVRWLLGAPWAHLKPCLMSPAEPHRVLSRAGKLLCAMLQEECKRRGVRNAVWAQHREGRHGIFSGSNFLLALGTRVGSHGAA